MNRRVANFYKVSFEQFLVDMADAFDRDIADSDYIAAISRVYENIKLPKRATSGSAGYDMYSTIDFELNPGETIKIPMGIKSDFYCDWVLTIVPRSSVGFKYNVALANTIGVIDSDYFNNEKNEGHIFVKLKNLGDKKFVCHEGDAIVQGIFLPYGITEDDNTDSVRSGGIGSTGV